MVVVVNLWFCFSHVLIWFLLTLNASDVSTQMTKLAIIPCTVLLETIFLGKRFRFHLASYQFNGFYEWFSIYTIYLVINYTKVHERIVLLYYLLFSFCSSCSLSLSLPSSLFWPEVSTYPVVTQPCSFLLSYHTFKCFH